MYPPSERKAALDLLRRRGLSEVSRMTGVHRSTLRIWLREAIPAGESPRCDRVPIPGPSYGALLGYYLGDGCLSRHRRYFTLRVSCDARHGPGRKHERPIVLEPWQVAIVEAYPAAFLRGLFHSDGSRVRNWTTRMVAGERKRYDYPRWQFTNVSTDIQQLCCWALDLVDVPWRQSNAKTISVSTRAAVARLDTLIELKR